MEDRQWPRASRATVAGGAKRVTHYFGECFAPSFPLVPPRYQVQLGNEGSTRNAGCGTPTGRDGFPSRPPRANSPVLAKHAQRPAPPADHRFSPPPSCGRLGKASLPGERLGRAFLPGGCASFMPCVRKAHAVSAESAPSGCDFCRVAAPVVIPRHARCRAVPCGLHGRRTQVAEPCHARCMAGIRMLQGRALRLRGRAMQVAQPCHARAWPRCAVCIAAVRNRMAAPCKPHGRITQLHGRAMQVTLPCYEGRSTVV
jgi:hypothetical protein